MNAVMSNSVIGLGIVFNQEGHVLIDQRLKNVSMGGMWEFPGGKQERHESIAETIAREIKEELLIEVNVGVELISFDHLYTNKKLHFIVHICEWIGGSPKPLSCQQFKWVALQDLDQFPFPAANKKIIEKLHQFISSQKNN